MIMMKVETKLKWVMNTQVVNYVQIVMNLKLNGVKSLPSTRDEQRGIIKGRGT